MKLLAEVGLRLSGDFLPASPDNPDGHFEDVGIVDAQQLLLRSLHLSPYLPLPDDWTDSPAYGIARRRIATIVADEVTRDPRPWGFKDPRTCALWPLWQDVLATANAEPRVVFCVRRGEDVVRSKGYGINVYDSYYGDTSFVARWYCAGGWVGVMCGIGKVQYNLDKIPSTQTNYHNAIACHEEGHGVGLAHTTNSFSCMQDPPTSSDKNYSYHDVVQHINSLY